jgi:hypothetical protein
MVNHLKKHEEAGHYFPKRVYEQLWEDDELNFGTA